MVVFDAGSWKMKAGETLSRPFKSESDAISAAMKHGQKLRDGYESEVVMKVMTCRPVRELSDEGRRKNGRVRRALSYAA